MSEILNWAKKEFELACKGENLNLRVRERIQKASDYDRLKNFGEIELRKEKENE